MSLEHVRRLLLSITLLSLPILAGLWLRAPSRSYGAWGYAAVGVFLLWVIVALAWTSIPVARALGVSHVLIPVFWLGLITSWLFTGDTSTVVADRVTPDVYLLFVLLGIVAYLLFSTPVAPKASLGLLLSTTVVVGAWFAWTLLNGRPVASIAHTWMYLAILGVTRLMLHALARNKDRYAGALLEAARTRDMAYTDTLTSLPNRRELEERLERTLVAANELGRPLSVVFFDLDDFKGVNDVHGHGWVTTCSRRSVTRSGRSCGRGTRSGAGVARST